MQKWLYKMLMLIAVATVIGHNTIPHHHDEFTHEAFTHHHDHHGDESRETTSHDHHHEGKNHDNHNIFSFAQLDKDFVNSHGKICVDLPIFYLLAPVLTYHVNGLKLSSKNLYAFYKEFPPPGNFSSNLFSRPPPSV
jgi:hypothetical protein